VIGENPAEGHPGEKPALLKIDFGAGLRTWDGFGLNYVESAHSADPETDYEDYGGFSTLPEASRQQIMDLLYGSLGASDPDKGLRVSLHKIFLDPFHQLTANGPFVGPSTSSRMSRYFLVEAAKRLRTRNRSMDLVTTYYGVPAWATTARIFLWRDVDPARFEPLAEYMADWISYLRSELLGSAFTGTVDPRYASLTNEGESARRWNADGSPQPKRDYNAYWPARSIAEFLPVLANTLQRHGLDGIRLMPCETAGWDWLDVTTEGDPIAEALLADPVARRHIGVLGGHSFSRSGPVGAAVVARFRREFGDGLRAWTTSHDWRKGDVGFAEHTRRQIYEIGVTGIITWAATKRLSDWERYTGRPANPQCAILIKDDGTTQVQSGYYFYKQFTWAGQPGMSVAAVDDRAAGGLTAAAFGSNGTRHPAAFVVINPKSEGRVVRIVLAGGDSQEFQAFRTCDGLAEGEAFKNIGIHSADATGAMLYHAPAKSATTFLAK